MKSNHRLLIPLVAAFTVAASTGCGSKGGGWKFASWDMRKAMGFGRDADKPDPEIPVRLVTTWTEAVLNRPGETPKRGFGGRLAFFKNGSEDPVRVDGNLVVYAFDETSRPEYDTQPTRRYVFPAEQFAIHESQSQLGPAYSVWLPWDEAGGHERKVSLIAKFEPRNGVAIVGEQTKHYLAGPPDPNKTAPEQPQLAAHPTGFVQQAAYVPEPAAAASQSVLGLAGGDRLDTATIPLPRRLNAAPGEPLRTGPQAAEGQLFTTPHMPGMSVPGASSGIAASQGATTPTTASPAAAGRPQPTSRLVLQLPGDMPTTGYLTPPGFLGGRPQ